jgi:hypothetical protein
MGMAHLKIKQNIHYFIRKKLKKYKVQSFNIMLQKHIAVVFRQAVYVPCTFTINKCVSMMSSETSNDCLMDKLYSHLKELQCIATAYLNLAYIYMMSNMSNPDAQTHMKHEENLVVYNMALGQIFLPNITLIFLCQYELTN